MSERPTEALQRRIDGEGQGLMFRDGKPETMRPVPISELRDAVDTIAALTDEVERLRGLLGEWRVATRNWSHGVIVVLAHKTDAALTPPTTSLSTEEGLIRSLTEVRDSLKASDAADQPDLTKCPDCNGPADQGFSRDVPPVPYSCSKCEPEQPAPEDNLWRPCPDCKGKTACDCYLCWGRGRVPATEDDR